MGSQNHAADRSVDQSAEDVSHVRASTREQSPAISIGGWRREAGPLEYSHTVLCNESVFGDQG